MAQIKNLSCDIESFSSAPLNKCGVYKYAASPDFEILLFGYSADGGPVRVVDFTVGEQLPAEVLSALTDPAVTKWAFNAQFERVCLSRWLGMPVGEYLEPDSWRCTMVWSATLGLPLSLEGVGAVLGLEKQKLKEGKDLIRYFCTPAKDRDGIPYRHYPEDAPEKWERFKAYNLRDVETEMSIQQKLSRFPVPEAIWDEYHLDQEINDRGIAVDMELVRQAIGMDARSREKLTAQMRRLTNLENPNSVQQMKQWLADHGLEMDSLGKKEVAALLKTAPAPLSEVLLLRQQLAKSSVKKYTAMATAVCPDGRARGMFQFYGANRTGRFCLTGDHEVLTDMGWQRLDEWEGGKIACWTPNGETVSFQKANALSFPYEGLMYEYTDKRIAQVSTPDHKMYVKRRYGGEWQTDTVENMEHYRPSIPFTGYRQTIAGMEHSILRVLVMVQADGCFKEDGSVIFAFTKMRKVERCKSLLRGAGLSYVYRTYEEKSKRRHQFKIYSRHVPLWLRLFRNKTFDTWLFDESADVFFEELVHWDGHRSATNSIQYVTCNKKNADIVQAFAHISGRAAQLKVKRRSDEHPNWNDAYYVDIWLTPKNCHEVKAKPHKFAFEGTVYCAETPSGFFLVRRNGRVWVTGNSGRIIQLQNLPQNHIPDLAEARSVVRSGDFEAVEMLYEDVPDTLSQLIRTAFVPQYGRKFIVSDFSAIEARVIAWFAGEQWRQEVFAQGGDIYCASASQMFHVPVEKHGRNAHLRQKGKIAELALGYGGSVGALKSMGALEMGVPEDELKPLVDAWRTSNPHIVQFWWDVDREVKQCVKERCATETHGLRFAYQSGFLFITLPSGRRLAYVKPKIGENRFGGESVTYEGVGGTKKWERLESYGPKFVENCIAAGTLVVAQRGLVPIEEITDADILWDGCEWCHHDGLIAKGRQTVVKANGIYLTPEHRILTEKGWVECAKSSGLSWAAFSLPDSFISCGEHETGQGPMAVPVHLRSTEGHPSQEPHIKKESRQVVRLYAGATDLRGSEATRHEPSSCVRSVALHEAEVPGPESSCVPQLRWPGNHGLQGVEREFRGVLEGYGTDLSARVGFGQDQQQRGLPAWKLPVDHSKDQHSEQADKSCDRHPIRQDDGIHDGGVDGYWRDNAHIPSGPRLADRISVHETGLQKPVYDIRNCGPRHRFAVWDGEAGKVRIVSNCVQATARDILMYAMQTLRCCSIVAHVHDELIIECDRRVSLAAVCEQMGRTPPWAKGLLLRADGYECDFYKKD